MCGMLSSISRATAMFLISAKPVVFAMCCKAVLSGWNASGMYVTKPCVSSCNPRRRTRWSTRIDLVVADDPPHALVEDLRAAAGQRIHARVPQALQGLSRRDLRAARQIPDLHHREGLQVDSGETLLQPAQHLGIPVERQLGVQ